MSHPRSSCNEEKNMIELIEVNKRYRTHEIETQALKKISLSIQENEFVSIMGPSGSGKSSLLNIIGLIDSMSSGQYYFNKQNISTYNEKLRSNLRKLKMGFVFQKFNLIDELSVYQNIELPLNFFNVPAKEKKKRVLSILEKMSLTSLAQKTPLMLSGGQQQSVAVARALITEPQVILADEPTGNLDSQSGKIVMNLLKEIHSEGSTVIMTTHSMDYAQMGSRIINLYDGEVVTESFFESVYPIKKKKAFY